MDLKSIVLGEFPPIDNTCLTSVYLFFSFHVVKSCLPVKRVESWDAHLLLTRHGQPAKEEQEEESLRVVSPSLWEVLILSHTRPSILPDCMGVMHS